LVFVGLFYIHGPPLADKNTAERFRVYYKDEEERLRVKLSDLRQRYPEYRDLNDQMLLDAVHKRFYSDMTWSEFNRRLIETVK
jgi:hypothetical protein